MSGRYRLEVEEAGVGGFTLILERPDLTRKQQALADRIIGDAMSGLSRNEQLAILALVAQDYADDLAYQRVCRQRGLLL